MELYKLDYEKMECKDADPEIFFFEGIGRRKKISREAAAYCGRCAIQFDCLQIGLNDKSLSGVWGGTSEVERDALRSRAKRNRTA